MTELIADSETEVKEAPPDVAGMVKFVGWLVMGVLAVAGLSWLDILGKNKTPAKTTDTENKETDDEDTQADYEKEYLDDTISQDALNEHTVGLTG
jgi:hypothetical protein